MRWDLGEGGTWGSMSWCTAPAIRARPWSTGTTPNEMIVSARKSRPVVSKSSAA